ncbi:MAG: tRNA (N(6)-L-threonylcarbamoyladenosine(37)-C(2))-methylthiotransferase MtaB [Mycoplasmataceae bacterium]|jgi:threonylcarbamoyladenosine tRNA methylthiotransferase MtaB|nr:tRNA (N(6)-L-threonylcarbamoyladenosine(37)-C(2))-methylthiotransferase MtaB [Mycoplasmataceae bacterium]
MEIKNKKFIVLFLGCRTNICESSAIIEEGIKRGLEYTKEEKEAEIVIINTCCVTNKAMSKSLYLINKISKYKDVNFICVCGCFSQYVKEIENPKVKLILGNKYKNKIFDLIEEFNDKKIIKIENLLEEKDFEKTSYSNSKTTRAFLKIQDGCNFKCSYCIIPLVRGKQRSCKKEELFKEIDNTINNGYLEIVLTGVNTAGYNDNGYCFFDLLKDIKKKYEKLNIRFRISSIEPFQITKPMIKFILTNNIFCPSLHICLQNSTNEILKDMKRKYSFKEFLSLCNYARKINPFVSLTTDYIVGFPSENEKLFKKSIINLKKIKLANMHIFPFSLHKGTQAYGIKNLVSTSLKKKYFQTIEKLNNQLKNKYLSSFLNKKVEVVFENEKKEGYANGHSQYFFSIYVKTKRKLQNQKYIVQINKIDKANNVFGRLIEKI